MIKIYSNLDLALCEMKAAMKFTDKQLFISYTKYGRNQTEYRLCTQEHVSPNSQFILYQTERKLISKNVKSFNYYRKWKQNK
ncbi:MAG: hypothetical protein PHZ24_14315 [Bacteroidales bacterium]|nr:hypothetical protein [Bacteroidales bacterium]